MTVYPQFRIAEVLFKVPAAVLLLWFVISLITGRYESSPAILVLALSYFLYIAGSLFASESGV